LPPPEDPKDIVKRITIPAVSKINYIGALGWIYYALNDG